MAAPARFAPSEITLPFADGDYLFRLGLPQIAELQEKCDAGLGAIFARVLKGRYQGPDGVGFGHPMEADWRLADLIEPIRLGLIGGNCGLVDGREITVSPLLARNLAERYAPPHRPLREAWDLSAAILVACVEGYEPPEAKKKPPPKARPARTKGGSTSPAP